jgi:hypothetical protein
MPTGTCVSSCGDGYAPQTFLLLGANIGVCMSITTTNVPIGVVVTTTIMIDIGTSTLELEISLTHDLLAALGLGPDRISVKITVIPSPGELSSGSSWRSQSEQEQASLQIIFNPEITNTTYDSTDDEAESDWQSARSLAMSFASQVAHNDSQVAKALIASGVSAASTSSLTYEPMFACHDGTMATKCQDWKSTDEVKNYKW